MNCPNPDTTPANVGFNGILGAGVFVSDCGPGCAQSAANGMYFKCTTTGTCSGIAVPEGGPGLNLPLFQVSNPVAFMPFDNNGVIVTLPAVSTNGGINVLGTLYMGIGTQANNTGTGLKKFNTDNFGNFTTMFDGGSYATSFIDSGSVGFYPRTNPACRPMHRAGTTRARQNRSRRPRLTSTSNSVSFQIANADVLLSNSNPDDAFNDLGAPDSMLFDWGLPFFFGRSIYVGIDGRNTNLGAGPFWAY